MARPDILGRSKRKKDAKSTRPPVHDRKAGAASRQRMRNSAFEEGHRPRRDSINSR